MPGGDSGVVRETSVLLAELPRKRRSFLPRVSHRTQPSVKPLRAAIAAIDRAPSLQVNGEWLGHA